MSILFESEYRGERHVGFGKPAAGDSVTLYKVAEDRLRTEFAAGGDPEQIVATVVAGAESVTVAADDPELRLLPPLLPTATGDSLVSGFMRTHRSKFETEPQEGEEFVPPNWFFKGLGNWLRLPGETLVVPSKPVALIEEPEVALVYVNDEEGAPHYAGYTFGNDLCDIGLHLENPGWNPYCKLCDTALTPWLFLGEPPTTVTGRVTVERDGATAWEGGFDCGEDSLYFKVRDMADHLFSFPAVRRPGLVNYVLLGADRASFHDGFRIADGDRVTIDVKSHDVVFSNDIRFGGSVTS
ncbi:fumarylacetoacetate (FAA) hydrolase [Streptomyces sp. NBC_01275]|uniref:fumarylacetoacetate (FAA) hydrolase n=1 Tax=Streptomyces sp. NBC_01275 TaxID=2903807 RepID=UPI0022594178|nr:fumarylacetoacetate (FAA) hydrolase [Streptomyces sp. NBC_01275]MCX4761541.1 fumarylacetoacetate (FAA) hydrolase [Streptomyces sp. NBC_01275]